MTNLYHQREILKAKGMTLIHRDDAAEYRREYWGWLDRNNALLDHSATITELSLNDWIISDFSAGPRRYDPSHAREIRSRMVAA